MFGNRARVYTVHINTTLPKPYENALFVEEGFSLFAFLFTGLWALYHRLWWPFFGIIVINLIILQMAQNGTITELGHTILEIGLAVAVGYLANDWRRSKLAHKGFIMADIVTGDSLIRAEQRFYDQYFATTANV